MPNYQHVIIWSSLSTKKKLKQWTKKHTKRWWKPPTKKEKQRDKQEQEHQYRAYNSINIELHSHFAETTHTSTTDSSYFTRQHFTLLKSFIYTASWEKIQRVIVFMWCMHNQGVVVFNFLLSPSMSLCSLEYQLDQLSDVRMYIEVFSFRLHCASVPSVINLSTAVNFTLLLGIWLLVIFILS